MIPLQHKFSCSHCGQHLECESEWAGTEIECPTCHQTLLIPPQAIEVRTVPEPGTASEPPAPDDDVGGAPPSDAQNTASAVVTALLGGLLGWLFTTPAGDHPFFLIRTPDNPGLTWTGVLVGLGVGWLLGRSRAPAAPLSLITASGCWALAVILWAWVRTRPPEAFHDQGGMVITFVVLPVMFGCWLVGGPFALALGRRGLRQAALSQRPSRDRRLAQAGIVLSHLMLWGGVALLALALGLSYQ